MFSVFHGETVSDLVVELSNPQLSGNDLSYDVKVLEGTLLAKGGTCALFIDVATEHIQPPFAPRTGEGKGTRYRAKQSYDEFALWGLFLCLLFFIQYSSSRDGQNGSSPPD